MQKAAKTVLNLTPTWGENYLINKKHKKFLLQRTYLYTYMLAGLDPVTFGFQAQVTKH